MTTPQLLGGLLALLVVVIGVASYYLGRRDERVWSRMHKNDAVFWQAEFEKEKALALRFKEIAENQIAINGWRALIQNLDIDLDDTEAAADEDDKEWLN